MTFLSQVSAVGKAAPSAHVRVLVYLPRTQQRPEIDHQLHIYRLCDNVAVGVHSPVLPPHGVGSCVFISSTLSNRWKFLSVKGRSTPNLWLQSR